MRTQESALRKFRRAAQQRLATAEFLVENGYNLDAVYLAGYAVECALKLLILRRTPASQFVSIYEEISTGRKAHDFEFLKHTFRKKPSNGTIPDDLSPDLRGMSYWSTSLRYESIQIASDKASAFAQSAWRIVQWMERSL
jgi:HEPN domain